MFFTKEILFKNMAKSILKHFESDADLIFYAYHPDENVLFRLGTKSKFQQHYEILNLNESQKHIYFENDKKKIVKAPEPDEIKYMIDMINLQILNQLKSLLKQSLNFKNDSDLRSFEWFKTSLNNLQTALIENNKNEDVIINCALYFKREINELFLQLFNYDIVFKFFADPAVDVIMFENKVIGSEIELSKRPVLTHRFNEQSLQVLDILIQTLEVLAALKKF